MALQQLVLLFLLILIKESKGNSSVFEVGRCLISSRNLFSSYDAKHGSFF